MTEPTPAEPAAATEPDLGDAGKKALDRMKAERDAAKAEARKAAEELARLKTDLEGGKTDAERMAQQLAELRQRADEADRRALIAEVAQAKGLSPAQARRLQGATKEELEADAEELLSAFKSADGEAETGTSTTRPTAGRPREQLRPASLPRSDEGSDTYDPAKFLAAVPRG